MLDCDFTRVAQSCARWLRTGSVDPVRSGPHRLSETLLRRRDSPQRGLPTRRTFYGARYAEFLDNVTTYHLPDCGREANRRLSRRRDQSSLQGHRGPHRPRGRDQFNLQPNGNYYTLRANALENNLVLWKYERGKRSCVKWVRNTPTPTLQWHDLKVKVHGAQVQGYLDGKLYLEHTLPAPVSGRVGVWSKADSVVYFADYRVIGTAP